MKRYHVVALVLLLLVGLAALAAPPYPKDKDKGESGRLLTGRVIDRQDNPLSDAVV